MTGHRAVYLLQHSRDKEPSKLCSSILSRNMFQDELAQRISENQLRTCKSYQIVGRSELESLKHRARKRTKVNIRIETHCEQPNLERKGPILLSKKEVVGLLPKIVQDRADGWSKQVPHSLPQGFSGRTVIKDEMMLKGTIDFRVSRVKERFQQYKKEWHKHLKQNYSVNTIDWAERKEEILSGVVNNEGRGEKDGQVIRKSSYWPATLRNQEKKQQGEYKLHQIKTLEGEVMSSRGRSKLLLQTSWIEGKEEEGCKFKPFGDSFQAEGSTPAPR